MEDSLATLILPKTVLLFSAKENVVTKSGLIAAAQSRLSDWLETIHHNLAAPTAHERGLRQYIITLVGIAILLC